MRTGSTVFDNEWHYTSGNMNFAMYSNLPAGDYTFRVRPRTIMQFGLPVKLRCWCTLGRRCY
ncbi:MAG: triple tyrosine motif-containing protein [Bacteroidota bacterium]